MPSAHRTNGHGRLTRRTLEEMAEGELIAETECRCDFCQRVSGRSQECTGAFDSMLSEIRGKRFAYDAEEQFRTILFRVAQEVRQHFQCHASMDVLADERCDTRR